MPEEKREGGREKRDRENKQPNYDGDTYNTSHQRKTGVAHDEPPKDLREKGED